MGQPPSVLVRSVHRSVLAELFQALFRVRLNLERRLPLAQLHVHFSPAKPDPLRLQPQPLFNCRIAGQLDLSAGPQHALPRQSKPTA